jgi:glycosyltransferase involved in cell wall biosynthesis
VKKIIISSNILWTITQFRLGLISYLKNNDFEVVCLADNDNFSELSESKIRDVNAKFIKVPLSRKGLNPFLDLKYFINLLRIYRSEKPDLIINYTIKPILYGSIAAFLLRIPSFAVTTGLGFSFIRSNFLARFIRLTYKTSLRFPKKVFFLNNDDHELFIKFRLVYPDKCVILPGEGINTSFYMPGAKISGGSFKFLLIARLLWDKGVGEYIEAIKILKKRQDMGNAEYLLLGYVDENNPSGIESNLVKSWHDNELVNYLGTVEDTRSIIQDADCIVLPSYREGVPRTLLEAASMEKPIIASNSVGCKDVVEDNSTGFLCSVKDSLDLAEKMIKMYHIPEAERYLMGKRGREKMIRQFDDAIIFGIYSRELKEILNSK